MACAGCLVQAVRRRSTLHLMSSPWPKRDLIIRGRDSTPTRVPRPDCWLAPLPCDDSAARRTVGCYVLKRQDLAAPLQDW